MPKKQPNPVSIRALQRPRSWGHPKSPAAPEGRFLPLCPGVPVAKASTLVASNVGNPDSGTNTGIGLGVGNSFGGRAHQTRVPGGGSQRGASERQWRTGQTPQSTATGAVGPHFPLPRTGSFGNERVARETARSGSGSRSRSRSTSRSRSRSESRPRAGQAGQQGEERTTIGKPHKSGIPRWKSFTEGVSVSAPPNGVQNAAESEARSTQQPRESSSEPGAQVISDSSMKTTVSKKKTVIRRSTAPATFVSGAKAEHPQQWQNVVKGSVNERVAETIAAMYRESLLQSGNSSQQVVKGVKLPKSGIWKPMFWRHVREPQPANTIAGAARKQMKQKGRQRELLVQYSNSKFARVTYRCSKQGQVTQVLACKFPVKKSQLPHPVAAGGTAASSVGGPPTQSPTSGSASMKAMAAAKSMGSKLAKRMSMCKDTRGRRYDIKKLRQRRFHAVMKGMTWMYNFLKKDNYKRLYELGDDMPSIFFECWYTSADTRIRTRAKGIAKVLVDKLEADRVAKAHEKMGPDSKEPLDENDFFECMFMLRCKHEMGMDCDALLKIADAAYSDAGLSDTNKMFECEDLASVPVGKWLLLLMRVLIVEYMNLIYRNRWPIQWGMRECFLAIRDLELKTWKDVGEEDEYDDAFYLATHIVFAISAYSATKTDEKDVPWLYAYVRGAFKHWRKNMRHSLRSGKHDTEYYVDIDGIGEILDNLRGAGLGDASDPMVCELSVFLLDNQHSNGAFPCWFRGGKEDLDNYDKIHSTWVCTQALRDRDFKIKENFKWVQWMNRLLKTTQFGVLNYKPTWTIRKTEFSYEGLTYTHGPAKRVARKKKKKKKKPKPSEKAKQSVAPLGPGVDAVTSLKSGHQAAESDAGEGTGGDAGAGAGAGASPDGTPMDDDVIPSVDIDSDGDSEDTDDGGSMSSEENCQDEVAGGGGSKAH